MCFEAQVRNTSTSATSSTVFAGLVQLNFRALVLSQRVNQAAIKWAELDLQARGALLNSARFKT